MTNKHDRSNHVKAHELRRGDVFRLSVSGEVLSVTPVANGKRVKVRLAIEDQGHRSYDGGPGFDKPSTLEFLDSGHTLEFICKPSRKFRVLEWSDDGDDGGSDEAVAPPDLLTSS